MKQRYRYKSKRAKRPGRSYALYIILFIIICIAATVIYGNYLKQKVDESRSSAEETSETQAQSSAGTSDSEEKNKVSTPSIKAGLLSSAWVEGPAAIQTAVGALTSSSFGAATVVLRGDDGIPRYKSQITGSFIKTADTQSAVVTPAELTGALHSAGLYTSGYFTSFALTGSKAAEGAATEYEIALIGELSDAGINEILISGLPITVNNIEKIKDYFNAVKDRYPNLAVGAVLNSSVISSSDAAVLFKSISLAADFLATDATGVAKENFSALLQSATLYISKYNLRVLIAQHDSDTAAAQLAALDACAVYNWQIIG